MKKPNTKATSPKKAEPTTAHVPATPPAPVTDAAKVGGPEPQKTPTVEFRPVGLQPKVSDGSDPIPSSSHFEAVPVEEPGPKTAQPFEKDVPLFNTSDPAPAPPIEDAPRMSDEDQLAEYGRTGYDLPAPAPKVDAPVVQPTGVEYAEEPWPEPAAGVEAPAPKVVEPAEEPVFRLGIDTATVSGSTMKVTKPDGSCWFTPLCACQDDHLQATMKDARLAALLIVDQSNVFAQTYLRLADSCESLIDLCAERGIECNRGLPKPKEVQ